MLVLFKIGVRDHKRVLQGLHRDLYLVLCECALDVPELLDTFALDCLGPVMVVAATAPSLREELLLREN